MITLGIETSCDDTSVAVVKDGVDILSNIVSSQVDVHKRFGGIVPEIAARKHYEAIIPILKQALESANIDIVDIDQIAATAGPGLLGPLLVGLSTAKALAISLNKTFIPVNHLEGHLQAAFLASRIEPQYPYVGLIVSGGHSTLVWAKGLRVYEILGKTVDDAPGELYDKVARFLNLGFPGGPIIQKIGTNGDPTRYKMPKIMVGKGFDFSFSGLKTYVIRLVESEKDKISLPDLCASLQEAVKNNIIEKLKLALEFTKVQRLIVAGGVAANMVLRKGLEDLANNYGCELLIPPPSLCTDNAAMIASCGYFTAPLVHKEMLKVNASANWPIGSAYNM